MRSWLILLACGCSAFAADADKPSLAPPPDSAPPITPMPSYAAPLLNPDKTVDSAVPADDSKSRAKQRDGYLPDSVGSLTLRPMPDEDDGEPAYLKQFHYLKSHNDTENAAAYLGRVVANPDLSAHDRARAILELCDCLADLKRSPEELTWLKIWMQLYPTRPEVGAVAYRMGTLYTRLGLSELARDSYYLALSNAVNHGQVQDSKDLTTYTRLTVGTLWALAQNEYAAGDWARAAQLFDRYQNEAQSPPVELIARSQYLQADCYYQLRQNDQAYAAYQKALTNHPFQKLAPEARLRLYHLDMLAKKPKEAEGELEALIWTVRTCWPADEAYWQKRTGELLMALNHDNAKILPPLLAKSSRVSAEDKAWQAELGHYDKLANLEATSLPSTPSSSDDSVQKATGMSETDDLLAMRQSIDALTPTNLVNPDHP